MKLITILFAFSLVGCSSLNLNSNAGSYLSNNIENNLRKNAVKTYTPYKVWKMGGVRLGFVEAGYCQQKARDHSISKASLVSLLKVKTQKLGGNALVLDSCSLSSTMTNCHRYTQCQGHGYNIAY
ncbi:hypothetical protein SAMN05216262_10531 [Colwellia chukchiensis]|uniref:RcsF protein n=1 Tax=Colwellia chukchiensis TaxID=641665 RepID=A0A1H7LY88_9GAMM|nr:hypothetical protein [Colwellia chukchiensis]SEL03842.1 hypothetical protein SAMN05216262_10531 [Colwellia chukchiensis]